MGLSMSTYNYDPKISRSEKEEQDADLRGKIEQIRVTFPRAGYRPLLHYLVRSGVKVGETKLRRILKEAGLQIHPKKKFVRTTQSEHDCLVYPNLIQGMSIDGVNQVWAGDITYIRINNGFVFLAVMLDLYSRKVIKARRTLMSRMLVLVGSRWRFKSGWLIRSGSVELLICRPLV